jgi:hypothetical protein
MNLKDELLAVINVLNKAKIPYALCGGLAVVLHGYPRLTRDIDMLILEEDLSRAKSILGHIGFIISGGIIPFDINKTYERKVFRISKAEGEELLTVDMILVPEFLQDVWNSREKYEIAGIPVYVVDKKGLITMKEIAGRPQDISDIENLKGTNNET